MIKNDELYCYRCGDIMPYGISPDYHLCMHCYGVKLRDLKNWPHHNYQKEIK